MSREFEYEAGPEGGEGNEGEDGPDGAYFDYHFGYDEIGNSTGREEYCCCGEL